jgi:hypothetical protein
MLNDYQIKQLSFPLKRDGLTLPLHVDKRFVDSKTIITVFTFQRLTIPLNRTYTP